MHRIALAVLVAGTLAGAVASAATAAPRTTLDQTIQDTNGDNLLEYAAGEDYTVDGAPQSFRPPRQGSLVNFLQLSDFQMVDEESPARVEFLDFTQRGFFNPFSAAYRPQESLTTHVTEAMVRQARNTTSPVTGERLDLTILTGDNADSQQFNETRWFIDALDGTVGPRPGALADRIDPNSGVPIPGCEATPGSVYDGVRDDGDTGTPDDGYYEPDSSQEPREDGDGYSPERADNIQEVQRDVTVRDFPGLFESANSPFEAVGLGMPWYSAFGNHDALVQGNSPEAYFGPFGPSPEQANPTYQAIATGCVKVKQPSDGAALSIGALQAQIEALKDAAGNLTPEELEQANQLASQAIDTAFNELTAACEAGPTPCATPGPGFAGTTDIVPPDPRRCFLAKDEPFFGAPPPCSNGSWIAQHFMTTGSPVGHGFAPTNPADCERYPNPDACRAALDGSGRGAGFGRPPQAVANHDGYYSFAPAPGLRFVVLDTVTDECGSEFCSEGSVDHTQFTWLEDQLLRAEAARELVLVFSHHTLRTTRFPSTDLSEQPIHFGQRVDRRDGQPQNQAGGETLEELYCRHPVMIAHVAGHEHENYVERHECESDTPPTLTGTGEFVHVSTAAHIDWPQQSRMIEVIENGNGTLSLVLTVIDHQGPPDPGNSPLGTEQPPKLASVARELSYNDYQGSRGARGASGDRNVIVVMPDPRP